MFLNGVDHFRVLACLRRHTTTESESKPENQKHQSNISLYDAAFPMNEMNEWNRMCEQIECSRRCCRGCGFPEWGGWAEWRRHESQPLNNSSFSRIFFLQFFEIFWLFCISFVANATAPRPGQTVTGENVQRRWR